MRDAQVRRFNNKYTRQMFALSVIMIGNIYRYLLVRLYRDYMTKISQLGETLLIEWLVDRFSAKDPNVIVGNGNDASVIRLAGNISFKVDTFVLQELPHHFDYYDAGWKAVMACASDLAAVGSKPKYALVSFSCPRNLEVESFKRIFHGIEDALRTLNSVLLGGDLSETSEVCLSVCMLGEVKGRPLLRNHASPGDLIAVSRGFGLEALGLKILFKKVKAEASLARKAIIRFKHPYAEVEYGEKLSSLGFISSCSDSSDGLIIAIKQLIDDKANAIIDKLPTERALDKLNRELSKELTMYGGEEYALVYTYSPQMDAELVEALKSIKRKRILIGRVVEGNGDIFLQTGHTLRKLKIEGWRQFQSRPLRQRKAGEK
jgi:thiamine-monophosphate kinase